MTELHRTGRRSGDGRGARADDELARTVEIDQLPPSRAKASTSLVRSRPYPIWSCASMSGSRSTRGTDWIDLDPSLPGTSRGARLAEVVSTSTTLADEYRPPSRSRGHRRARRREGRSARSACCIVTDRAEALAGQPISLFNVTPEGLSAIGVQVGGSVSGMRSLLAVAPRRGQGAVGQPFTFSVEDVGEEPPRERIPRRARRQRSGSR